MIIITIIIVIVIVIVNMNCKTHTLEHSYPNLFLISLIY